MSCSSLRNLLIRLRLESVYHVRELHGILNEENGKVNANNIEVASIGVETSRESTNVSGSVSASVMIVSIHPRITIAWLDLPSFTDHGRESYKCGCLLALFRKEVCCCDIGEVTITFKDTVDTGSTSMYDAFGNLVMVSYMSHCD